MSLEALKALTARKQSTVEVDGHKIHLREWSAGERIQFEREAQNDKDFVKNFRYRVLLRSIADEEGNRLLTDKQTDVIDQLPSSAMVDIFNAAMELNKLNPGGQKADIDEAKNS